MCIYILLANSELWNLLPVFVSTSVNIAYVAVSIQVTQPVTDHAHATDESDFSAKLSSNHSSS